MTITSGHLLGGRIRYAQPRHGFRSGIEPVLLAASVPARAGERVLEGGSGAGATLLCLAARVPNLSALGVERDESLVTLAAANAAANGFSGLRFVAQDMASPRAPDEFDHACANPPYHAPDGTVSPDPVRRRAKLGGPGLIATWVTNLALHVRVRGTLTLILPAALLPEAVTALADAVCPATVLLPLWPKAGRPAKLVLLRGVKGGQSPFRVLPGLVLHEPDGAYTSQAEAILRDGAALGL